jgi:hypothetical protein
MLVAFALLRWHMWCPLSVQEYPSAMSCALPPSEEHVGGGLVICCWWSFLLPTFLSLPVKIHVCLFFFWFFNFNPLCFLLLIFVLDHFRKKKFMFLIQSLNYNFSYIIFHHLIFLICHFYPWIFVKILLVFNVILQSKFMLVLFFNLNFILLISLFFLLIFFFSI